MLDEKIDYLHTPKISIEVLLSLWFQKFAEQWRPVNCALGNRVQESRRCLSDTTIAEKCFAQGRLAVGTFNWLVAFSADPLDDFSDQCRIICSPDRH